MSASNKIQALHLKQSNLQQCLLTITRSDWWKTVRKCLIAQNFWITRITNLTRARWTFSKNSSSSISKFSTNNINSHQNSFKSKMIKTLMSYLSQTPLWAYSQDIRSVACISATISWARIRRKFRERGCASIGRISPLLQRRSATRPIERGRAKTKCVICRHSMINWEEYGMQKSEKRQRRGLGFQGRRFTSGSSTWSTTRNQRSRRLLPICR